MTNKKRILKREVVIVFACFVLFILAIGILLTSQRAIEFVEAKFVANNYSAEKKTFVEKDVAGVFKKPTPIPNEVSIAPPQFSATAVLAMDLDTEQIFFQKNIHQRLSPASTTKIMTALVSVEYFKPSDVLVVFPEALVGGSTMGLSLYEKLPYRSLLYGMLLNSGNDAAFTIAANYPGGTDAFIKQMNSKVAEMGLNNTHFQNPAGFDGENHYSSAWDLARIAIKSVDNYQLARVVGTKETYVSSSADASRSGVKKSHYLKNLNKLLSEEGVIGIKTGYTERAGENLVTLVSRDNHKVLTVVLNSQDRFGETKALIDWIYQNFSWK